MVELNGTVPTVKISSRMKQAGKKVHNLDVESWICNSKFEKADSLRLMRWVLVRHNLVAHQLFEQ